MKKLLTKYKDLPKNLFGLLFWNMFFAFFVLSTVHFNGEPAYGMTAFIINLTISPLMSLMFTVLIWLAIKFGNLSIKLFINLQQLN